MKYFIEVRNAGKKGRGVFALKNFSKGELIEKCPVIPLSETDSQLANKTHLHNYLYEWQTENQRAVILGYGFIYNHSYTAANSKYYYDFKNKLMIYKAVKEIKKGKEILINYNRDVKDRTPIDWIDGIE